jgi:predicted dehydrogenase
VAIKSTLGVAILGLGRMGETHLRNLLGLPGVKVVVVADPRLDAAERGKALAGAEEATTDVEGAINNPSVDAGELGRIELFRALSRDTYPPPLEFLRGSGGLFLDMAVHDLDLARFLIGEVEEVHAWGTVLVDARFSEANDADTAVTLLRFANGALGVMETSRHSNWGYDIRTEIAGSDALETLRLALAVTRSWREGRPVKIAEI